MVSSCSELKYKSKMFRLWKQRTQKNKNRILGFIKFLHIQQKRRSKWYLTHTGALIWLSKHFSKYKILKTRLEWPQFRSGSITTDIKFAWKFLYLKISIFQAKVYEWPHCQLRSYANQILNKPDKSSNCQIASCQLNSQNWREENNFDDSDAVVHTALQVRCFKFNERNANSFCFDTSFILFRNGYQTKNGIQSNCMFGNYCDCSIWK